MEHSQKHSTRWSQFVEIIRTMDNDAKFDVDGDPHKVQHSTCSRPQKMVEPYNTSAFKKHLKSCTSLNKAMQKIMTNDCELQTLFAMVKKT